MQTIRETEPLQSMLLKLLRDKSRKGCHMDGPGLYLDLMELWIWDSSSKTIDLESTKEHLKETSLSI